MTTDQQRAGSGRSEWASLRVTSDDHEAVIWLDDEHWQMRAVLVGKGIEIQRHPLYHGWVHHKVAKKWAKSIRRISKAYEEMYGDGD